MTYKKWERKLKKELSSLPKTERERVLEYYREMHDEMASNGRSDEGIIAELGSPESCARKTLSEEGYAPERIGERRTVSSAKTGHSVAEVIGLFFATVLLVLPIGSALFAVLVSFAAVCVSGAAVGVAGLLGAIVYPIVAGGGVTAAIGAGAGLAASGVGLILFVVFFLITKYTAIILFKIFKAIYKRG